SSCRTLQVRRLPPVIRDLIDVTRLLHQVAVVHTHREMAQQIRPENVIVIETDKPLPYVGRKTGARKSLGRVKTQLSRAEVAAEKAADAVLIGKDVVAF